MLRVDDKKELSDPPRVQEKELKEPERISLRTPKDLELKETELGRSGFSILSRIIAGSRTKLLRAGLGQSKETTARPRYIGIYARWIET